MTIRDVFTFTVVLFALAAAAPVWATGAHAGSTDSINNQSTILELPQIRWTRGAGLIRFIVTPGGGTHLAADLPVEVRLRDGESLDLLWKEQAHRTNPSVRVALPLGRVERPDSRQLSVRGAVCNDDESLCQPFLAQAELLLPGPLHGRIVAQAGERDQLPGRRPGSRTAPPGPPPMESADLNWFQLRKSGQWRAALDLATRESMPLLVAFSTEWCPACKRLQSEFIDQLTYGPLLRRFVRVAADADHHSSFELKSHYGVGGYPTLLVLRADGTLLERTVGFDTPEDLAARLEAIAPSGLAQDEGARGLLVELRGMAAQGEWEAGWLRIQSLLGSRGGDETVRFAVLSLAIDFAEQVAPTEAPDLARRAAEIAPRPGLAAGLIARSAGMLRTAGRTEEAAQLEQTYGERLGTAIGARHTASVNNTQHEGRGDVVDFTSQHDLASAAWYRASWMEAGEGRELYARAALRSAAQVLEAGEPGSEMAISLPTDLLGEAINKTLISQQGPIHDIISSLTAARLPLVALPICTKMAAVLPEDFTWHYKLAGLQNAAGDLDGALISARRALDFSYGDNKLRASHRLAEILADDGALDEARQLIEVQLAEPAPAEKTLRTHRYRRKLQELLQTWHDEQRGGPR